MCQADEPITGEGSAASPSQSNVGRDALKRKIFRAIASAIQFKEFGRHVPDPDNPSEPFFEMTGEESDRLESACNEATEAVLKIVEADPLPQGQDMTCKTEERAQTIVDLVDFNARAGGGYTAVAGLKALVATALREEKQEATNRAVKIARFIGDNTQKDPMMKNLAHIIADAIESREMLELNVAIAELLGSKSQGK